MPHHEVGHPRRLSMTVLMTPETANFSGKVHGGHVLKLLDQVAYACATRYCGHYAVTLAVDQVFFRSPIHVGELVTFLASVNYTGRTSMEVGIKVIAEDNRSRKSRHVLSSFFTLVAVDESGKPCPVEPLEHENDEDRRRWTEAELRRKLREDLESRHREIRKKPKAQANRKRASKV